ncbi:hypothetical protein ACE05C_10725 [Marinobacter shengliensis]
MTTWLESLWRLYGLRLLYSRSKTGASEIKAIKTKSYKFFYLAVLRFYDSSLLLTIYLFRDTVFPKTAKTIKPAKKQTLANKTP